jgi:hypothetical protein
VCFLSKKRDIKIILKIAEIFDRNETSKDSLSAELILIFIGHIFMGILMFLMS